MAQKEIILTVTGLEKLENELVFLKTKKRREIAEKIKQAIAFGDISENSEYDEAKNEQAFVEGKIFELENMLKNAKVIDEDDISVEMVSIGSRVAIKDLEIGEILDYTIVSSAEADPLEQKISIESPIGKALLGHETGETVEVQVPDGVVKYEIMGIYK